MFSNEKGLALRLNKSFCPLCNGSGVAGNSSTGTCNRMKRMSIVKCFLSYINSVVAL
jgi:hypothetical protein